MTESTKLRFKKQKLVKYLPISLHEGYLLSYASSFASLKQQSVIFHIKQEEASEILKINYLTNMAPFQDKGLLFWNYSLIPKIPRRTTTTCWLKLFHKDKLIAIQPPPELQGKRLLGLNMRPSKEGMILIAQSLYLLKANNQEFSWVEIEVEKREQAQFFRTGSTAPDLLLAWKKDKKRYLLYRVSKGSAEIIADLPYVLEGPGKHLWIIIPHEIIPYPSQSIDKVEKLAIAFDSAKTRSRLGIITLTESNPKWETIPRPYYSPITAMSINGQQGVVFVRQQKRSVFSTIPKIAWYDFVNETTVDTQVSIKNKVLLLANTQNEKLVVGTKNGELSIIDLEINSA